MRKAFAALVLAFLAILAAANIGSIFVLEPIMIFLVKENVNAFLGTDTPLGFSIGTILEGLIPGIVLALIIKTDLALIKVTRPGSQCEER